MKALTSYIALFLLLLFVRVMTPNELLLLLHAHEHTIEAPHDESTPHIGQKHTHCNTDNLFHAPFQPAEAILLPIPVSYQVQVGVTALQAGYSFYNSSQFLRGPPVLAIS